MLDCKFGLMRIPNPQQGIYIHVPFCHQACSYCNFFFVTGKRDHGEFLDAAIQEIEESRTFFGDRSLINTLYFGGGTPSRLQASEIERILDKVQSTFELSSDAEITLEANPEDISQEILSIWHNMGINRISLGIQSFNDKLLALMRRAHNREDAQKAAALICESPFENYSFDLIIGQIFQDLEMLDEDLHLLKTFKPPHLSTYLLTVEEKTHLYKEIQRKRLPDVKDTTQEEHYLRLMEWARENQYEHYETSSFAIEGFQAKHNSNYWNHSSYLGIGPSAHSFDGKKRYWNTRNFKEYINEGVLARNNESLSRIDIINERIMLGLRQSKGINLNHLGLDAKEMQVMLERINGVTQHHIHMEEMSIKLSPQGKLYADGIAAALFL